ncbi:MAG: hypothetical protein M9962_02705 [Oligoflexia bacterium]|nr:hypothetical protein [Oligoflexia bacterium]
MSSNEAGHAKYFLKNRLLKLSQIFTLAITLVVFPSTALSASDLNVCAPLAQNIESIKVLLELSSRRNMDWMEIETKINSLASSCENKSTTLSGAKQELKALEPRMESFSKIHKILVIQVPFVQSRLIDLAEKKCSKELESFGIELKQAPEKLQVLKATLAKSCGGV